MWCNMAKRIGSLIFKKKFSGKNAFKLYFYARLVQFIKKMCCMRQSYEYTAQKDRSAYFLAQ